ncbi:MAG: DUF262 domain-containing protein [Microcoleus sp.]
MPAKLEKITLQDKEAAEAEIRDQRQQVNYDTREYPLEILLQKCMQGIEDDTNELSIPDYPREMAWDEAQQSKFIESVILGLPISYILVAEIRDNDNDELRLEIIDGTQRIRTLARFVNNELTLSGLKRLDRLNGFKFADLLLSRQSHFKRTTLRTVQLSYKTSKEVRRDLFERLNPKVHST